MILGIDASNIRRGGGLTHLVELLGAADPEAHGFSKVVVWSGRDSLNRIADRSWLLKQHDPTLEKSLIHRGVWQRFTLARLAQRAKCDILFVPGGTFVGDFHPIVTMSQNLLPFEWRELRRYGWSWMTLKFVLLRLTQGHTFRRADGLIFLSRYAREAVMRVIKDSAGESTMIAHGIDKRFFHPPREQAAIERYSDDRPFRILYVSIVDVYKHQWRVAEAIAELHAAGIPVSLELIGPAYAPALVRLNRTLARLGPAAKFVRYVGTVPFEELHARYIEADLCVFASSCENMPNILLEGMASGLPLASSDRGPMSEMLGEAGVYFDPEDSRDIARALRELIESPELRRTKAAASFDRAHSYSWTECAALTFAFLARGARASA
jgi:glycosyltransferase involved in cell wall biosynthesis